jgi:micrococcal nuclease
MYAIRVCNFLAIVLSASAFLVVHAFADFSGRVVGISDGDTIKVFHNGKAEKVRLYGIDCPEKSQRYGITAKQFTSQLVFGKEVIVKDYGLDNKRFKRTLGEIVLPDGRVVNEELLRAGLAWWYRKYVPNREDLAALEEKARIAKRGLWADPKPVPPWEWRKRQGIGLNQTRKGDMIGAFRKRVARCSRLAFDNSLSDTRGGILLYVLCSFGRHNGFKPSGDWRQTNHWLPFCSNKWNV